MVRSSLHVADLCSRQLLLRLPVTATFARHVLPARHLLPARLPLLRHSQPAGACGSADRLARFAIKAQGNEWGSAAMPRVSERVRATDAPCIVKTKRLMAGVEGVVSLAQGVVHWAPPAEALSDAAARTSSASVQGYGACEGLPELRDALRRKLREENGLEGYEVMVTVGANQAFVNVLLALVDATDGVVLFKPYYFNHLMAVQMTGGGSNVIFGECDPSTWHPDLDWLQRTVQGPNPPRMVVIINPNNPTGVMMSQAELQRASDMCAAAGVWLVLDNTYEHFVYDGRQHHCVAGPHVINLFSFSKAYGMMGWRVGYIAYPLVLGPEGEDELGTQLVKVQDTIPICPAQLNQHIALWAVNAGRGWVAERVLQLEGNRRAVLDALSPLGDGVTSSEGAIYVWARLPAGCEDDEAAVAWLAREHKVCLLPGTPCGCPGYVRAAFANLQPAQCAEAAMRLKAGLQQLVDRGPAALASVAAAATA